MVELRRFFGVMILVNALIFLGYYLNKMFTIDDVYLIFGLVLIGTIAVLVILTPKSTKN